MTVLTIFVSLQAFGVETETKKLRKKVLEPTAPRALDLFAFAEYSLENETIKDSNIYYYLDLYYSTSYTHRFRYFQRVSHILIPEQGKDNSGEVTVLNPRFMYFYNFQEPADKSYHLALRLGTELGTSSAFREDNIQAVSMLRLEFDKRFLPVTVSLRPYVSYWSTQYATNSRNEALPLFTVGHNLYVTTQISKKWMWNIELDTGFQMFQPADVKASMAALSTTAAAEPLETSKTVLFFGTEIGYRAFKNFQMRLGYYQFDKFVSEGKYDIELFNNTTTRMFIGLDYIY